MLAINQSPSPVVMSAFVAVWVKIKNELIILIYLCQTAVTRNTVNLTFFSKKPVLIFSCTSLNPGNRDKPLITGAASPRHTCKWMRWEKRAGDFNMTWSEHVQKYAHETWKKESYLNSEGTSTTESGFNRKCFWEIFPVLVSMVTTGNPICRIHRFMITSTEWGSCMPALSTAW